LNSEKTVLVGEQYNRSYGIQAFHPLAASPSFHRSQTGSTFKKFTSDILNEPQQDRHSFKSKTGSEDQKTVYANLAAEMIAGEVADHKHEIFDP